MMANATLKEACVNPFTTNKWMTHNKVHHVEKMPKGSNMYNTNPICKVYFSKLCLLHNKKAQIFHILVM